MALLLGFVVWLVWVLLLLLGFGVWGSWLPSSKEEEDEEARGERRRGVDAIAMRAIITADARIYRFTEGFNSLYLTDTWL